MALRSPLCRDFAIACACGLFALPATGAVAPVSCATAAATSAKACTQLAESETICVATGIAQSKATSLIACNLAPWRTAWRKRKANKGWSLRTLDPMTKARCRLPKEAIEVPNQRAVLLWWKSDARKRASMFWLPKPRIKAAAKYNSSVVLCGLAKVPINSAPYCDFTPCKPLATYSSAVCQSTVFHSPPCLSIGAVSRSWLSSAS